MGYLSGLHIYRLIYDYGNYTLDITGYNDFYLLLKPLNQNYKWIIFKRAVMVSTQKLTSLAFAYYDGMRPEEKLNDDQKTQVIK